MQFTTHIPMMKKCYSYLLFLLNIATIAFSDNYFTYDEMDRDISVEIPITYVHYGIHKESLNYDIGNSTIWMELVRNLIEKKLHHLQLEDEDFIDPTLIKSAETYGILGPLVKANISYDDSQLSPCYRIGKKHPEPLSYDELYELRKLGVEDDRNLILLPTYINSHEKMTHIDGSIVLGDIAGLTLADDLLALQVDDKSYFTFQKKVTGSDKKPGLVKSYCQQINSLNFNKPLSILKLKEILNHVDDTIGSLEVTISKLNMLKIHTDDPVNSNIEYQPELTWQSYLIVQEIHNLFSPHETKNSNLNSLLSLTKTFSENMQSFEARTRKDQFLQGNQRCQLSHTDDDYVIKCKQMLFTNMDRMYITPIPFVMEHTLYQLMYQVYDFSDDHCITYGNTGLPRKQFRVYLELKCCNEIFNNLVPRHCPLVQLKSKAMIIDTGEYEILIPNTDGSTMTTHCQGETTHDPIYKNGNQN